jgi:hypothetical protein
MGFPVTLYNRTFEHVAAIKARGGIETETIPFRSPTIVPLTMRAAATTPLRAPPVATTHLTS